MNAAGNGRRSEHDRTMVGSAEVPQPVAFVVLEPSPIVLQPQTEQS